MVTNGNTNDITPTFSGTGTPGDVIPVYLNGNTILLGATKVGADGIWSSTPTTDINPDSYQVTITAADPAGNVGQPSTVVILNIDTTSPTVPTIEAADGNAGTIQGDTVENGTIDDSTSTV